MTADYPLSGPGHRRRARRQNAPVGAVAAVALVFVAGVCTSLMHLADGVPTLDLSIWAFVIASALLLLLRPRGITSARTWVIAYLVLQFPIRTLYLLSVPKERPPIYALFLPGVGLEGALQTAMLQSLVGLLALGVAYVLASPRAGVRPTVSVGADVRAVRAFGLLVLGALLLPVEALGSLDSGFLISLPGIAASGAAAVICYAFVQAPRRHLFLFVPAIAYTVARVTLLSSKLAILSCVVAIVISASARAHSGQRQKSASLVVAGLLVVAALQSAFVFAVAAGRSDGHTTGQTVSQGMSAAVSRSYGVDALVATNEHLHQGGRLLYGQSFAELGYSWVPRAVWPAKPKSFSIRFGEDVFSFSTAGLGTEFFAPSYSGEWVLNFGVIGLVVGWLLFGWTLARIDRMPSLVHRMLWLAVAVHFVEGSLVAQFWLAAPFVLGGYWVLRRTEVA